jgi:hypothetical protein
MCPGLAWGSRLATCDSSSHGGSAVEAMDVPLTGLSVGGARGDALAYSAPWPLPCLNICASMQLFSFVPGEWYEDDKGLC